MDVAGSIKASGHSGALRVGYQPAATLGEWTLDIDRQGAMHGQIVRSSILKEDAFWVTQRPIDLVLYVASVEWVWRGVNVVREGTNIVIALTERPIIEPRSA